MPLLTDDFLNNFTITFNKPEMIKKTTKLSSLVPYLAGISIRAEHQATKNKINFAQALHLNAILLQTLMKPLI